VLRTLFSEVFGHETASNNAAWLRRKLAEVPDSVHGQRRSPVVRARDQGAAIWNQDQELMPAEQGSGQPDLILQQQQQPLGVFAAHPGALSGLAEQVDMSLEQQMQLDGVTTMSEAAHMTHTSPSECLPGWHRSWGRLGSTLETTARLGTSNTDDQHSSAPDNEKCNSVPALAISCVQFLPQ